MRVNPDPSVGYAVFRKCLDGTQFAKILLYSIRHQIVLHKCAIFNKRHNNRDIYSQHTVKNLGHMSIYMTKNLLLRSTIYKTIKQTQAKHKQT